MIAFKISIFIVLSLFCTLFEYAIATKEISEEETDHQETDPCIVAIHEKFGKFNKIQDYAKSAFLNLKLGTLEEGPVKEYYLEIFGRLTATKVFGLPDNYCRHIYQYGTPLLSKFTHNTATAGAHLNRQVSRTASKSKLALTTAAAAAPAKAAELGKNLAKLPAAVTKTASKLGTTASRRFSKSPSAKSGTSDNESEGSNKGVNNGTTSRTESMKRAAKRTASKGKQEIQECLEQFRQEKDILTLLEPFEKDNFTKCIKLVKFIYEQKTVKEYEDGGLVYVASYLKYAVDFVTVSSSLRTLHEFRANPKHTANEIYKTSIAEKIPGREKIDAGLNIAKTMATNLMTRQGKYHRVNSQNKDD